MMIKRIYKKIRIKMLGIWRIFGRRNYIKHLCKVYRKYGVEFNFTNLPRWIAPNVYFDTSNKICVGDNVTIASETIILTHDYSIDYGLIAIDRNTEHEFKFSKEVTIGNNTFIGQRVIILPGVNIGNNCIIGAGAIVNRDIPDFCVVAGVPAKVICDTKDWINKRLDRDSLFIK